MNPRCIGQIILLAVLFGYAAGILLVVEGTREIATDGEKSSLSQFDRIVVPHDLRTLEITAQDRAALLECLPLGQSSLEVQRFAQFTPLLREMFVGARHYGVIFPGETCTVSCLVNNIP